MSVPICYYLLDSSHCNEYEVVSHYGLDYISLMTNDMKQLFMCLLAIYLFYLEKHPFRFF